MTLAHCPAPTTAERIRSICVRAGGAMLAVDGAEPLTTPVHHLLADGSFAVGSAARIATPIGVAGDAGVGRLRAAAAARTGPLAGVDPRPTASGAAGWVRGDARPDRRRTPEPRSATSQYAIRPVAAGDTLYCWPAARSSRWWSPTPPAPSRSTRRAAGRPARPVLRLRILLAPPPRLRPPRRGRPAGLPAASTGCGAAGSARSASTATACVCGSKATTVTTTSGCRSRTGRRRDRAGPGHPRADGLPVRERASRAPGLNGRAAAGYRVGVTAPRASRDRARCASRSRSCSP